MACYDTIVNRMADVFNSGMATELKVDIDTAVHGTRVSIADDGAVEDDDSMAREGIANIRRLATDVGGNLRISESRGGGYKGRDGPREPGW